MGIKKLYKFLSSFPELIAETEYVDFSGKVIAIDISILLYQVVIAVRNTGEDLVNNKGEIISHILGLFNKTMLLIKRGIIPIYVFDGKPPDIKKKILDARKYIRIRALEKLANAKTREERIKYFKRCVQITQEQIDQAKELLDLMGIPYVNASEEADSQCAYLSRNNLVDAVLTEDLDILTFGSKYIVKNLTSHKLKPIKISLQKILETLDINYKNFVEFCVLLGCDYSNSLSDVNPDILFFYYKKYLNIPDTLRALKCNNFNVYNTDYDKSLKYFLSKNTYKPINRNELKIKKPNIRKLKDLLINKYCLNKFKLNKKLNLLVNNYNNYDKSMIVNL
jgi:flap endonuclease-1